MIRRRRSDGPGTPRLPLFGSKVVTFCLPNVKMKLKGETMWITRINVHRAGFGHQMPLRPV